VHPTLKLAVTVDVEEEGLFTGRFPRSPSRVANVAHLDRLLFIAREYGFPLTLLITYRVAENPEGRRVLLAWRDRHGAELGAHLHHWNTPPFSTPDSLEPVRPSRLPQGLLADKLATLVKTHTRAFGEVPLAFRMGRFA
jgi:peptidoglycan/xylan/chitin deacetylase (PgdA/CDA1 family)